MVKVANDGKDRLNVEHGTQSHGVIHIFDLDPVTIPDLAELAFVKSEMNDLVALTNRFEFSSVFPQVSL